MPTKDFYRIEDFTETLGHGIARIAYYSKKHDLVLKQVRPWCDDEQSANEKKIWDAMTKEERKVFPVVKFFKQYGKWYIVMPRITTFTSRGFDFGSEVSNDPSRLRALCIRAGANPENIELITRVRKKYKLRDLHESNLGWLKDGSLVIIDMGI